MITIFVISFISVAIFFILAVINTHFIRQRDNLIHDEPFELTEMSKTTPTPTPVYKKRKRNSKTIK